MSTGFRKKTGQIHRSKEIEESLQKIYGSNNDHDLTKIEHRRTSRLTSFLLRFVLFLLFLTLISLAGFFWWQSGSGTNSEKPLQANFALTTPFISGTSNCFKLNYQNIGRVPLSALSVSINLPKTFTLQSANPGAAEENHWILSPLSADSDGSINLCGVFRSPLPSAEKLQAVFTYRAANFSSDFQDIVGTEVAINQSSLETTIVGPTETVVGDETAYTIQVKNSGPEKNEKIQTRLILPSSFTIKNAEPAFSEENTSIWDIPSLETGVTQEIKFTGTFTNLASGLLPIVVETGFLNNNTFQKQNETKTETNVIGGELAFHLIINGSEKDQTVDPGGRLRLSLDFTNQGQENINDISFILEFKTNGQDLPLDFTASDLTNGSLSGSTITWNKNNNPALASLTPTTAGVIDSTLVLSETFTEKTADNFTVQVKATIGQIGSLITAKTVSSTPVTIKINSDASLLAEARYYDADGAPLGSGPLPPKVEQTTTYRIFWTIANNLHDLKNTKVTMALPANVSWTNNLQADEGSLTFNETTRQINWQLDQLSKDKKTISAWFDVAITPETNNVGSFFILANPASFEATDTFTNDLVHGSIDALTTALPNDNLAAGKGVVE